MGPEQFHRNQAMIAHNWRWLAGWRTIPGLPCSHQPAGPPPPPLQQQRQCRHWRHHHPDAQQLPCCANLQHQQSGAAPTHQVATRPRRNLSSVGPRGGVAAPNSTPGWQGDFLQTCEFGRAAILRPMAARPCSLAPALGNVLVMPN